MTLQGVVSDMFRVQPRAPGTVPIQGWIEVRRFDDVSGENVLEITVWETDGTRQVIRMHSGGLPTLQNLLHRLQLSNDR